MPQPPSQTIFQLRLELEDITPTIWRRILVPGSVRLAKLHDIIQVAMGWTNSHLHSFTINDERYGMKSDDYLEGEIDETDVTVIAALKDTDTFSYEYDFGDSWEHTVTVEAKMSSALGLKFAVCLDGENACPPEDCGGAYGFEHMLEALNDPSHEEHSDFVKWLGGSFDPTEFSIASTNAALQRLR